jgi:hippurate hydrolase
VGEAVFERMVAIRRDLHRHPELGWHEERTSRRIQAVLSELRIPFRVVAGTGIIADLPGPAGVPHVALRADMDALPVKEETGLPFASDHDGLMHACGHDGHMSILLGAAELLASGPDLPAPVRLIFQPAEEVGGGAAAMVEAGAMQGVGMVFGGHLDRHYPAGVIAVTNGAVNASADKFRVTITGQGAHAARPHESVDAVVVGSLLVMALQTMVSREVNPAHPSVVTVGRFDAGTAHNVIADRAVLEGTIRCQEPSVRSHLQKSLLRITDAIGKAHGATARAEILEGTPALINEPGATALAREAAREAVGEGRVTAMQTANMGGEDFSVYLEKAPGCYVRFGGQVPGREGFPAHSSRFDFDEQALGPAAAYYRAVAFAAGRALRARGAP